LEDSSLRWKLAGPLFRFLSVDRLRAARSTCNESMIKKPKILLTKARAQNTPEFYQILNSSIYCGGKLILSRNHIENQTLSVIEQNIDGKPVGNFL
jgi:hypothetical protein